MAIAMAATPKPCPKTSPNSTNLRRSPGKTGPAAQRASEISQGSAKAARPINASIGAKIGGRGGRLLSPQTGGTVESACDASGDRLPCARDASSARFAISHQFFNLAKVP